MSNSHDKILEAFLDEMLGNQRPGRAAADVVRHIRTQISDDAVSQASGSGLEKAVDEAAGTALPVAATRIVQSGSAEAKSAESKFVVPEPAAHSTVMPWVAIVSLAAALLITTGLIVWLLLPDPDKPPVIAEQPTGPPAVAPAQPGDQPPSIANTSDRPVDPPIDSGQPGENGPADEPRIVSRPDIPDDQTALVMPPKFVRNVSLEIEPQSPVDASRDVDKLLATGWENADLQPVAHLDLDSWATRLMTRVLGRTPTAAEKTGLDEIIGAGHSPEQTRRDILDWLVASPEFEGQFAAHWGRSLAWKMLGLGRSLQTTDPDLLQTRDFLTDQIADDKSLDAVVYELISVVGSTDPEHADFQPAASYLIGLSKRFGQRELATAHIADTFLGRSIQCAQCHDSNIGAAKDSLAGRAQQDFYELHSFFAQMRFERIDEEGYYVVNRNFLPNGRQGQVEAPFRYTDLSGSDHEVYPEWGTLRPGKNGFVAKVDRRSMLAATIVASPEFRQSMVDHVWTALLNVPLSGIDDSGETGAREQQEILQDLASQWAANGFRLPWLVRTIVLTEAFAVGVGSEEQLASNNPFLGAAPRFNQFYQRLENRRSAAGSLAIVAGAYQNGDPSAALSAGLLARIDGAASAAPPPRVIQAWLPTNENQWATSPAVTRQLDFIAADDMPAEQKIRHLVQAALGRRATTVEIDHGKQILESASDQRTALQDIWWSLLNSVEYQLPLDVW